MARVYLEFDKQKEKWKEVEKSDFWIDRTLLTKLDNLKKIQRKEWDGVILIDGMERAGKSILGMICAWYLSDCKATQENFARGLSDCANKISKIDDGSILIVDEGSTMFASKDSANNQQKKLLKILDVVGQKNLIIIICLPCIFDLAKQIAVRRSKFLLHVYPDENYDRGQYAFWGERDKSKLYRYGKKDFDSYRYPPAEFVGQFFNFKPPFYENYLKEVKRETLKDVLLDAVELDKGGYKLYNLKVEFAGRLKEFYPKIPDRVIGKILDCSAREANTYVNAYKRDQEMKKAIKFEEITKENSDSDALREKNIQSLPTTKPTKEDLPTTQ